MQKKYKDINNFDCLNGLIAFFYLLETRLFINYLKKNSITWKKVEYLFVKNKYPNINIKA